VRAKLGEDHANTAKPPSRSTVKRRGDVERSTICCRVLKPFLARFGAMGASAARRVPATRPLGSVERTTR
jgi:hypothetical protein